MNIDDILKGIPRKEHEYGVLDDNNRPHLDRLEEELFKRGTLAADDIDWSVVKAESLQVLKFSYHLSAIRGLIFALLETQSKDAVLSSCMLLQAVSQEKIDDLHPKPAKAKRMKLAWLKDVCNQLAQAFDADFSVKLSNEQIEALHEALIKLQAQNAIVDELKAVIKLKAETDSAAPIKEDKQLSTHPPQGVSHALNGVQIEKLDAKGRAQLRRDVLTMAHKMTSHFPNDGAAYHMRGFVGWMEFQFTPEADDESVTQLQPMPRAVVEQHRVSHPSLSDILKLEERLASGPDWFEGHKYVFDYAQILGWEQAAHAVRIRVQQRLKSWPIFYSLYYANKQPMVSDDVKKWLDSNHLIPPSQDQDTANIQSNIELPEGFLEAVTYLNEQLTKAPDLRRKSILKLELARTFLREGLSAQACMMADEIEASMRGAQALDWDASLLSEIQMLKNVENVSHVIVPPSS